MPPATDNSDLTVAGSRLDRAQAELTRALDELPVSVRANKKFVTARLRLALAEIDAAKEALARLVANHEV